MERQRYITIVVVALVLFCGALILLWPQGEKTQTPPVRSSTYTITVYGDGTSVDPHEKGPVRVAEITALPGGEELQVTPLSGTAAAVEKVRSAVVMIAQRPALRLTVENEEMVNGVRSLVMKEISVQKGGQNYMYAVREVLVSEFGLTAEIKRKQIP